MKKIIHISVWTILVAGLFVILGFAERQHQSLICRNLDILIRYNSDDYFITVDDINTFFAKKGLKIRGAALSDIDAGKIEAALYTIPYVEKADVYVSIDGDVKIRITQKKPIVKVFNKINRCFYIDDKGHLMQKSDNYSARLLVANGFINEVYNPYTKLDVNDFSGADTVMMKTSIYKVFRMAQFVNHDDFWKAMVDEIFINNKGEIELFTKIGNQTIVFGDIDNMEEKFDNLLVFYKQGLNKTGWNKYKTINLKYKNQVVCSKN
ncbi:MAG: hypothetical protein WC599_02205 [Bacteroidales bacterium]